MISLAQEINYIRVFFRFRPFFLEKISGLRIESEISPFFYTLSKFETSPLV